MDTEVGFVLFNEFFLSSDSSDSSTSTSSDDTVNEPTTGLRNRPKIENYVEEVVDKYTDLEFKENFRMNRNTFNYILNEIKDDISSSLVDRGHPTINAKSQILIALWYFATPDSYRSICSRFNIGKATGLRCVRRVTDALLKIPSIISWPRNNRLESISNGFNNMGFPDIIGCIDGTYIPIPMSKENGPSYICRKNFAAIILQAVCDNKLLFTHCYAGEVGSRHDATVLRRSEIWQYMTNEAVQKFPNDVHLLGDKAYPCTPQLITPYKNNGHLTDQQRNFNYLHAKCRSTIERAFALLKRRFRILHYMDVRHLEWIPKYIIACCVLHNICILQDDIINIHHADNNVHDDDGVENICEIRHEPANGANKRNRICQQLH